jgi:hypothetical protein
LRKGAWANFFPRYIFLCLKCNVILYHVVSYFVPCKHDSCFTDTTFLFHM